MYKITHNAVQKIMQATFISGISVCVCVVSFC